MPDLYRRAGVSVEFSQSSLALLEAQFKKYPSKQPVVLFALHLAQKEFGDLRDDVLKTVANVLDLPEAHVYGVATFYTMFNRKPGGKTTLRVCTNISCMLRGAYDVLKEIETKTGLQPGESNEEFSLVEEECIAKCANAPAVLCGTKYFLDIGVEQVDGMLAELRKNPRPEGEVC